MCSAGPYDQPEHVRPRAATTEEEQMYPYLLPSMAVEHVKDLRKEATVAARVRQAWSARAAARFRATPSSAGTGLVRRTVHP
jgi:hypothetical protein